MKWQEFIRDYLTFTRKERIAILVILFIILFVALSPKILTSPSKSLKLDADTAWTNAVKKLEQKQPGFHTSPDTQTADEDYAYQYDRPKENIPIQQYDLFYFDPNTLSSDGWRKLGIKEKNVQTIFNYLSKGGRFYKPEDLKKIYGLRKDDYERIRPYIRINTPNSSKNNLASELSLTKDRSYPERNNFYNYSIIDINTADTTAFIALPGIGSKLASRIVNFRDKLGGFYSVEQVSETFGLPDSTFRKIKQYLEIKYPALKKININTATIDELRAHPYIKWSLANPLIAFRNEHGPFSTIEDIKKIPAVTDELFNKIAPYLAVQ